MLTNSNAGYATVLFQLGKSNDVLDVYYQNTQAFLDLLRNTPNMYEFVGNANIPKIERKKIIKRIFSRRLDQNFIYFIWAIIDFQRGHDIISILKSFMRLYEEYCGIVFVRISSAWPIGPSQRRKLEIAIKHKYKFTKLTTRYFVDPELIGGLKIQTNNFSIDTTIKNKLDLMKRDSFVSSQQGE